MPNHVTALQVMIASPSDVLEAREAVYTALSRWNEANTSSRKIALIASRWETGAVPMLGDHPQALINKQLVAKADIVIALFGSRMGQATPSAVSGTAEEIAEAEAAGKPVHLYFSTAPHANDVDPAQLQALRKFKEAIEERGLYGTFNSVEELTAHVWQAIEHDLHRLELTADEDPKPFTGVDFMAQPGEERLPKTDSRGRLKYETKRWIDLINRGGSDAENVVIEPVADGVFVGGSGQPTIIHAGQSRRFPLMLALSAGDPAIKVTWTESKETRERIFHVG
ncbi:MAG: DUF4062 domain-containing protein [Gordonia sp. (in: high G+C Gram-positive bacteria)]|nr:MAG: DUF4062 domain-containing protein [Gordonia sp. (in: high G+C Gram-positive bacteria)]